jgi:hypothetical protein
VTKQELQEEQYQKEAQRQTELFVQRQREKRVASDILSTAFRDGEIHARVDVSEKEADSDYEDVKASARAYAKGRNCNSRIRTYAQENESQREGVASALSWLDRKRKSVLKN